MPSTALGIALEVEAGRGTQGNAIYRDLIQTSLLIDARFLALAVLIEYRFKSSGKVVTSPDYRKTISLLDAIYASDRLRLSLDGVLIIGYWVRARSEGEVSTFARSQKGGRSSCARSHGCQRRRAGHHQALGR
jgi:hypothetical protein